MLQDKLVLNNGNEIPVLGLGTWFIEDDAAEEVVKTAISKGYRHIDTAMAYANERGVGAGIRNSGVDRSELFVTSKIVAEAKSYEDAVEAINTSLETLGLDYLDLLIIHSPQPWAEWRDDKRYFEENLQVWKALEEAYESGRVKAIGVSNFLQDDLENLLENGTVKPMVNQILTHIGNTPFELVNFCQKNDIVVEAYSPIAHGEALKNEDIIAMANKYEVSVPQLCIRYVVQLGAVVLPKTSNPKHMVSNGNVEFEISNDDMEALKNLTSAEYGEFSFFPVFSGK